MATLTANGSNGHHAFTLTVTDNTPTGNFKTSVDHNISYEFVISTGGGGWDWNSWGERIKWEIGIGSKVYSGFIPDYDGSSTVTLSSGNFTYTQSDHGTVPLDLYIKVTDSTGANYTCGNASENGTLYLSNQTKIQYKIYYNSNGGIGTMETQTISWGVLDNFIPNTFVRTGYKFIGWNLYRHLDNTWRANNDWYTQSEISQNGYEKGVYPDECEFAIEDSWIKDCENATEFTLYAVWESLGMLHINKKGAFAKGLTWVKDGGTWKRGIPWIKENGTWKKGGA